MEWYKDAEGYTVGEEPLMDKLNFLVNNSK